jgi:hypothetical protein
MIWIVNGSRAMVLSPGALQQAYAAEPTAYPGVTPRLIGVMNTSIALQTLADQQKPAGADKTQHGALPVIVTIILRLHCALA